MTTRTLPETLRPYLWDTDFGKLDMLVCCTPLPAWRAFAALGLGLTPIRDTAHTFLGAWQRLNRHQFP